jgi:hypothetical protein
MQKVEEVPSEERGGQEMGDQKGRLVKEGEGEREKMEEKVRESEDREGEEGELTSDEVHAIEFDDVHNNECPRPPQLSQRCSSPTRFPPRQSRSLHLFYPSPPCFFQLDFP